MLWPFPRPHPKNEKAQENMPEKLTILFVWPNNYIIILYKYIHMTVLNILSTSQEFVDSRRVTLKVNPQEPLPTLTAERCHDFQLHFYEPSAMESIYTVYCSGFKVFFQEPHQKVNTLELPTDDCQYVSRYVDKEFKTSRVLRGEPQVW